MISADETVILRLLIVVRGGGMNRVFFGLAAAPFCSIVVAVDTMPVTTRIIRNFDEQSPRAGTFLYVRAHGQIIRGDKRGC